jgi:cation diffusion facilitator family transporter
MIVFAALYIIYEAVRRWLTGLALENLGAGTLFITLATATNGALGWYLVKQGKRHHSIVLEANGKHVLTDVWTSIGVIVALILTMVTGWTPFDPLIAMFVALNILWTGGRLIQRSIRGLMDESDPFADARLHGILQRETAKHGIQYHNLRHRNAGNKLLIEFHLVFNDDVLLSHAHELATIIEQEIYKALPVQSEVISHLEPAAGHDEVHEKIMKSGIS